jgi:hypothetical protein
MASITSFTQSSEVRHDWVGQEQVRVMHLWEQHNYERKLTLFHIHHARNESMQCMSILTNTPLINSSL